MIRLDFKFESSGLDDALERLEGLADGGIERAAARALGGPEGGQNAAAWLVTLQESARVALNAVATGTQRSMVEGFVQRITHHFSPAPPTAEFTLAAPMNLLAQAMATQEALHTRTYPSADNPNGIQRLRQTPLDASPEQAQMIEDARAVVREWVETQKMLDDRDADLDFNPDAITDRVMRILGLGDRGSWRMLLSSPEMQSAGQSLGAAIEGWLADVLAGKPGAEAPRPGSLDDRTGAGQPPRLKLTDDPTIDLSRGSLSQADLNLWFTVVITAWKTSIAFFLPPLVRKELASGSSRKQAKLL